ncbi:cytochrome P450 [Bimuria novae-zelandiae CBS 107.79]|uniref:Cytochrome P450 n=1 Tax=Bimuria novae-zelandiae CBS 107.79 TaxID=1447943 RepID=A0A6A5UJF1_9PLEO|nr:cytochrome P450 [Bimuria novae-zelandiae CBS 107.79]KAF1973253.1 cytochrome P450 [Bimuria novae-zelandiae CBS 107.79]
MQIFLPLKPPVVIVGDYEEARDILMRRCPREFDRSKLLSDLLQGALPDAHIMLRTDDTFRGHRRLLQDLMSPSFLRDVAAPNIYTQAYQLVRLWETKARVAAGRSFDASDDIFKAALDAVFGFAFGPSWPHSALQPTIDAMGELTGTSGEHRHDVENSPVAFPEGESDEVVAATLGLIAAVEKVQGSLSMKLTWGLLSLTPTLRRARRVRDAYVVKALRDAADLVNQASGHSRRLRVASAVDHMVLREQKMADNAGRRPDFFSSAMRGELFGFIVGGHDTTSTTVAWGVKYLADHAPVQDRLRDALHSACLPAKTQRRCPSAVEILALRAPYLDAVIEEILRCGGTTPGLDREAMVDTQILGHAIPKGTTVLLLTQGPSIRSPPMRVDDHLRSATYVSSAKGAGHGRSWSDHDPQAFCPDRWLVPSQDPHGQTMDQHVFDSTAGPTLAFGLGPRACWGRRLAYVELRLYLVLIVWNFHLSACPPELSSYSSIAGVTSKPKQCYVRLTKLGL